MTNGMAEIPQGEDPLAALWPEAKPKSRVGGWRGHPNSLAALDAGRKPFSVQRKCLKCGMVARRGSDFCRRHARRATAAAEPGKVTERTAIARELRRLDRKGLLPPDLTAHPVWIAHRKTANRRGRAKIMRELVAAWVAKDHGQIAGVFARLRQLGLRW